MPTVNIHEAKTHLSRLVERAARGETFVIAKAGRPMVKLVPIGAAEVATPKRLGFLQGVFKGWARKKSKACSADAREVASRHAPAFMDGCRAIKTPEESSLTTSRQR